MTFHSLGLRLVAALSNAFATGLLVAGRSWWAVITGLLMVLNGVLCWAQGTGRYAPESVGGNRTLSMTGSDEPGGAA